MSGAAVWNDPVLSSLSRENTLQSFERTSTRCGSFDEDIGKTISFDLSRCLDFRGEIHGTVSYFVSPSRCSVPMSCMRIKFSLFVNRCAANFWHCPDSCYLQWHWVSHWCEHGFLSSFHTLQLWCAPCAVLLIKTPQIHSQRDPPVWKVCVGFVLFLVPMIRSWSWGQTKKPHQDDDEAELLLYSVSLPSTLLVPPRTEGLHFLERRVWIEKKGPSQVGANGRCNSVNENTSCSTTRRPSLTVNRSRSRLFPARCAYVSSLGLRRVVLTEHDKHIVSSSTCDVLSFAKVRLYHYWAIYLPLKSKGILPLLQINCK